MKHATKSKRKGEKTETTFLRLTKAYFYKAFETLNPHVTELLIPEGTEALPCDIFLLEGKGSAEQKALYHDPAPRTIGPVIHTLTVVHQQVMNAIATNNAEFINWLLTIPPVKLAALMNAPEPKGIIRATFIEHIMTTKSTINIDQATQGMLLFIKALAEAMVNCVVMNRHLPGDKNYPFRLCQVAGMPQQIIEFVRTIPPPAPRKKAGAGAGVAPTDAAATSAAASASAPAEKPAAEGESAGDNEDEDEADADADE